ncbi:MAG: hypothetical protein M1815_005516 [Lichina confinis]|nr:MAG: hypothetical protein M1815_005516 [Lichina confinis]
MAPTFTLADLQRHNKADNLWIVVDGDVYDLTSFLEEHPGGQKILQRVAGKDASKQFWKYHNAHILEKYRPRLQVGSLDSKQGAVQSANPPPKTLPSGDNVAPVPTEADLDKTDQRRMSPLEVGPLSTAPVPVEDDVAKPSSGGANGPTPTEREKDKTRTEKPTLYGKELPRLKSKL